MPPPPHPPGASPPPREALSIELEAALVRELRTEYEELNRTYFKRALHPASIELSDAGARLGRWVPEVRAIEIARVLVLEQSWPVVVEVLKHEMAHQYVHEVLGKADEAAHGPAFREVCARMGIDAAATGIPAAGAVGGDREARLLERIARLLALAGSPNVNEAQAAMAAAQRLMLKYNLEVAADASPRGYAYRHLGRPTGRVSEHERLVAAILAEHFFVEVIWVPVYRPLEGKRGSVLEVCGSTANLEMAVYVHAFLGHAAEELWAAHKRERGLRSNRDRRTYLAGVMMGFLEKLRAQRTEHKTEGLVWLKDADLAGYYRRRHPHIQHTRYAGSRRTEAHAHGRAAGRRLVIHRPVEGRASGQGKLLTR